MAKKRYLMKKFHGIEFPEADDDMTVREARASLVKRIVNGEQQACVCCGRAVQTYPRKLLPAMAIKLIELVGAYNNDKKWQYEPKTKVTSGTFSNLAYWDLIKIAKTPSGVDKGVVKVYKPTKAGIEFVLGKIKVPSHVFIYDGLVVGTTKADRDIRAILGVEAADYESLLGAVALTAA